MACSPRATRWCAVRARTGRRRCRAPRPVPAMRPGAVSPPRFFRREAGCLPAAPRVRAWHAPRAGRWILPACAAVPAVSAAVPSVGAAGASPASSAGLTTCASGAAASVDLPPENRYQPPIVAAASARPAIAMRSAAELEPRGASDLAASRREKSGRTCSSVRSSFSTSWRRSAASTNSRTRGAETGRCRNRYTTPEVIWLATFDCSSAVPTTTSTRSFQVSRRRSASPARSPSMNMLSSSATETRRRIQVRS